ncbi:MAG TPA: type IV secretion system DNA-binding domain-containing protein, partial [Bacteroidales bacterium]|nr:type IV secretion system DNA-binding domain-containing protein [Bacteroidales bacterium]
ILLCSVPLLFAPKSKKGNLATGYWGGVKERNNAKKLALKQIAEHKVDAVAFQIGKPRTLCLTEQKEPNYKQDTIYLPDMQRGTAVAGSNGSGKTASVIEPMLRSAIDLELPLIVYDYHYPKLTSRTYEYAKRAGYEVFILAPGFAESESCNILDFLRNPTDASSARQMGLVLNKNFDVNNSGSSNDKFFAPSGDQLAASLLMLAKGSEYPDIMMCDAILSLPALITRLNFAVQSGVMNPWLSASFSQYLSTLAAPETTGGITSTAQLMFTRFMTQEILSVLTGKTTIPHTLKPRQMIIIGVDKERKDVVGPLLATILERLVTHNLSYVRTTPLGVFLDEIPTLYFPDLADFINRHRQNGLCAVLGFQNVVQFERVYGKDSGREILGACNTLVIGNLGEYESAELMCKYIGKEEIEIKQKSRGFSGGKSSTNTSDQDRTRELIEPSRILKFPTGKFIIINPGYSNEKEAFVPFEQQIKIHPFIFRSFNEFQEKKWPRVAEKLDKHIPAVDGAELRKRRAAAEKLLPLPSEERKKEMEDTQPKRVFKSAEAKEDFISYAKKTF